MRSLLVLLALTPMAFGGFCVTFKPQSLKASDLVLGTGKDYGQWEVIVRPLPPFQDRISREQVMEKFPDSALFEWQARNILDRKALGNPRTVTGSYLGAIKDLGPLGMAYAGTRVQNPYGKAGLLIGGGVWGLFTSRAGQKAPDASETKGHLLPDAGLDGTHDWSGVMLTGLIHGAAPIGPICTAPTDTTEYKDQTLTAEMDEQIEREIWTLLRSKQ